MGRNASQLASPSAAEFAFGEVPTTHVKSSQALESGWLASLDASPCVTIVADLTGRVCFVNSEGRTVLGAAATEALLSGRSLCEAFADELPHTDHGRGDSGGLTIGYLARRGVAACPATRFDARCTVDLR